MATSIFTNQVPSILNGDDGTDYTLGTEFERSTDGSLTHGRWYCPNPAPVSAQFVLYDVVTTAELARETFGALTPGAWNEVALTSPVAYTAGTNLVAAVYTPNRYSATANFFGTDLVNGDITAPAATNGRLSNVDSYPSNVSGNDACFFADIVFASDDPDPAEGEAALGLELAVATTGRRDSAGAAALGMHLDVAAAGRRDSKGTADAGLSLTVAATGRRDSIGAAAAGLVLTVAADGARKSRGTATFTLNLAVAAAGPVAEVVPGRLNPSGSSPALTPGGIAAALTAS